MRFNKKALVIVMVLLTFIGLAACSSGGASEAGAGYSFAITNDADFTVRGVYLQEKQMLSNIIMLYQGEIFPGQSVEVSGVLPENYSKSAFSMNAQDIDGDYCVDVDGSLSEIAQLMIIRVDETGATEFAYNPVFENPSANDAIEGVACNIVISNYSEYGIDDIWLQVYDSKVRASLLESELASGEWVEISKTIPENIPADDWMICWSDELDDDVDYNWESIYPEHLQQVYVFWDEEHEEFVFEFVYDDDIPEEISDSVVTTSNNPFIGEWESDVGLLIIYEEFRWALVGLETDEYDEEGSYSIEEEGVLTLSREEYDSYYEAVIDSDELTLTYSGGGDMVFTRVAE